MQPEGVRQQMDMRLIVHRKVNNFAVAGTRAPHAYLLGF
jgi:hypothetical protein